MLTYYLPVLAGHLDLETIAGVWHLQSAYLYLPVLAKHVDLETITGVQHVQPAYLFLPVLAGHVDLETIAGVWHGAACLPQYPISHWKCRSGDHRWGCGTVQLAYLYLTVLSGHVDLETIAGVRHVELGLWRSLDSHHCLGPEPGDVPQILHNTAR